MKVLNSVKKILKLVYFLFPKIIREQYIESLRYYNGVIESLFNQTVVLKKVHIFDNPDNFRNIEIIQCISGRYTTVDQVVLYNNVKTFRGVLPAVDGALPDLYLLKMKNVSVIGWSNGILINKSNYYHPELCNQFYIYDNKVPSIHSYVNLSRKIEDLEITYTRANKKFNYCIHLLKEHSTNYYHWMFETLPRLINLVKYISSQDGIKEKQYSVLVNKGVPETCLEMLNIIMLKYGVMFQVEEIKLGELVECTELYYVSPYWYAFDNTRHAPNPGKDFLVDKEAVKLVYEQLNLNISGVSFDSRFDKIYLSRRRTQMRNIINQDEVETLMENLGFHIVYTDILSFEEQRKIFSAAKIVVGASGASFSNIVFMRPGSSVMIFSPDLKIMNYYIFQQLADVARVNLVHFLTTPKKNTLHIHEDFYINCNGLKLKVSELMKGVNNAK